MELKAPFLSILISTYTKPDQLASCPQPLALSWMQLKNETGYFLGKPKKFQMPQPKGEVKIE